eukprot:s874_g6.t1
MSTTRLASQMRMIAVIQLNKWFNFVQARASKQQYAEECVEIADGGISAAYCCVRIRGVAPSVMETQMQGVPFILSGLFDCEQKVSVVHGQVSRIKDLD